ncbi:MAG: pyridoxal-dependent decarboxylase [Candidatus Atabeyarchaeum deiterrae]
MLNEDSNPSLDEDDESSIMNLFLDPAGDNLDDFEDALIKSLKLLKLWWKGQGDNSPPRPSEDEVRILVQKMEDQTKSSPFTPTYKQLESCIATLFRNMRFNKNNLINVHPSPILPAVLASLLTMLQNPNNLSSSTSAATTFMEEECICELASLVGFSGSTKGASCRGNIVSCGTISNLTGLTVAREKAYRKSLNSEADFNKKFGLFGSPRGVILTTKSAHYSIRKTTRILGLGDDGLIEVPVACEDEVTEFDKSGKPFKLKPSTQVYAETLENVKRSRRKTDGEDSIIISAVATLGTINTGTIEPIQPLVGLRDEYGFHLHVDAAIGGLALGLDEVKKKASGVEVADSITIDPHKLGFIQYPCSAILFRNDSDLDFLATDVPYVDSCASTIEGSRPGSSAAGFWVALKTLGRDGYNRIIGRCISLTKTLGNLLNDAGYQVLHEVDLNTVCFALKKEREPRKKLNRLTSELQNRVTAKGKYLTGKVDDVSGIMVKDRPWQNSSEKVSLTGIRVWIMNPQIDEHDLELLIGELNERRKQLTF